MGSELSLGEIVEGAMAKGRQLTKAQAERIVKWNRTSLGPVPFVATLLGALCIVLTTVDLLNGSAGFTSEHILYLGLTIGITVLTGAFGWFNMRRLSLQSEALSALEKKKKKSRFSLLGRNS